jgi:hypothetical protein
MRATTQTIRREGEYWTLTFDGVVIRLRDSRGVRYLAPLLREPGKRFPATELLAAASGEPAERANPRPAQLFDASPRGDAAERARLTVTKGLKNAIERITEANPVLGAHLQATVRRGYVCCYAPDPHCARVWEE